MFRDLNALRLDASANFGKPPYLNSLKVIFEGIIWDYCRVNKGMLRA